MNTYLNIGSIHFLFEFKRLDLIILNKYNNVHFCSQMSILLCQTNYYRSFD